MQAYRMTVQVVESTLDDFKLGTGTYAAIFRLVDLIKRSCLHLEQSIWPQLESSVQDYIDVS